MEDGAKETTLPQTTDTIQTWQLMKEKIGVLLKSGLLPGHIRTVEQGMTIAEMGRAIGLKPIVAMNTIYVVGGKPTITPAMMLALAKQRGLVEDQKIERFSDKVIFTIWRKGYKTPHYETFGDVEAFKMGLTGKDNYKKQKITMYTWRTISAAMRFMFPDVIFGLYTPEEMGAIVNIDPENELDVLSVREHKPSVRDANQIVNENIQTVYREVYERLSTAAQGDLEEMEALLKDLTYHETNHPNASQDNPNVAEWVTLKELEGLAKTKPKWLLAIRDKLNAAKIGRDQDVEMKIRFPLGEDADHPGDDNVDQ